ncbi:MAG: glycosyltransferase family 2 protein [Candidatus Bathyarchaeota archaeon]|nr:glycosyltransferase family 2 protein [Candidatus Bathyarchaeota archaeon]
MELVQFSPPLASVIVLNYNGKDYLANCIESVLKNEYENFEVILVDNASTDNSLKTAQQLFGNDPRLKILQNPANLGFSSGNNIGFEHCHGEYVVFLNNDTIVEKDWLTNLVAAMEEDPSIGLAQSKILMMDSQKIQTAGWLFSNYLVRKQALGENKDQETRFQHTFEVSVASGASMIAKRALIKEVGLFDPKIPFFYDDTLLSFKVWLANKRVVTVENSRIRHMMGATSVWTLERTTFNLLKAKICLTFDIYFKLGELLKAAFVNFTNTTINSLLALKRKNLPVVYANMHGLTWALGNLKYLWRNRQTHWSTTKISPEALKERFVRLNIPLALYLIPSKLSNECFASAVRQYENAITLRL